MSFPFFEYQGIDAVAVIDTLNGLFEFWRDRQAITLSVLFQGMEDKLSSAAMRAWLENLDEVNNVGMLSSNLFYSFLGHKFLDCFF